MIKELHALYDAMGNHAEALRHDADVTMLVDCLRAVGRIDNKAQGIFNAHVDSPEWQTYLDVTGAIAGCYLEVYEKHVALMKELRKATDNYTKGV